MFRLFRPLSTVNNYFKKSYSSGVCFPVDPCDPGTQVTILSNGIRIATEYKPSPLACMTLLVEAGSRFETVHSNGITHFLEHLAYKGFCDMDRCAFENSVLMMGAKMKAKTTREMQTFTGIFLSECYPQMVDNLAAVVTNLEMNCWEVENEKQTICLEMQDKDNDPRAVLFDYLHQTAFQGTPLSKRVIGPSHNIARFDRETLRQFFCQHYQPYKFILSTSGAVPHDAVVNLVNKRLGHLSGCPSSESDDGPTRYTGSEIMYRNDSLPLAHVAIAVEAPGYSHPDYWKCLVASNILGKYHKSQGGGYNNAWYLGRAAAVDDLADSYQTFYITYRDIGLWGVHFVTKSLPVWDMVEAVQHQWMHLCVTTQFNDLERGLNATKLQLAQDVCGVENSCRDISTQMFYKCTRLSLEDKYYIISHITAEQICDCMTNLIYNKCPVVASVGPTECLPEYNRIRDNMYWLRF